MTFLRHAKAFAPDPVNDVACRLGAADGYGGKAPGAEYCSDWKLPDPPVSVSSQAIVDFHLGAHGDFWVCTADECHQGTYEEAVFVFGGRREIEGEAST